jgi:hypothetical protein
LRVVVFSANLRLSARTIYSQLILDLKIETFLIVII